MRTLKIIAALACIGVIATQAAEQPPNVIFILADDLGFNDVGFHGSSQIPTPNLDALAYSGLILNNYYVQPICTPSRSALMTGKHPIHLGMQHSVLYGAEPRGLSLSENLMPQYFKQLGYTTRIVGKWHLGSWKLEYTPTFRGFDSHLGGWTGHQDYNDHTASERPGWGLDMRNNTEIAYNLHGKYITTIITDEAVRLIKSHEKNVPLFLYVAHNAVHSGNPYNPLPAPDDTIEKIQNIEDYNRRRFAGMLTELDKSVGEIVEALRKSNMLENSIIVFSSDNGGPADGFNLNAASNWPLRGVKNTLWEGGVRAAGFLWSPRIEKPKRVSNQMVHITDWLPSLYAAAGGNTSVLSGIDGINLWDALSKDETSPREEILHNIDDVQGNSALTSGGWKIVRGTSYNGQWDSWYGPTGRNDIYNISAVLSSLSGEALRKIGLAPTESEIVALRSQADVRCSDEPPVTCSPLVEDCLFNVDMDPCEKQNLASHILAVLSSLSGEALRKIGLAPTESEIVALRSQADVRCSDEPPVTCSPLVEDCLFNVDMDPCEKQNLASQYPDKLEELRRRLAVWNSTLVPHKNLPLDMNGDPKYWNYVWTNFGDYVSTDFKVDMM